MASKYTQRNYLESIYQYELLLRWIQTKDLNHRVAACEQIFSTMKRQFPKSTMVVLWEYLFTYNILNDEALANIKLAHALEGVFTLETRYKYFYYKKHMQDHPQTYQEETDYIQYRQLFDTAWKRDLDVCKASVAFWTELLQTRPSELEKLALKLSERLDAERSQIDLLLKRYPNNCAGLKFAGSFYSNVMNNNALG